MVSENGNDWRTIHTFSDIKEATSLVHYFAKPEKANIWQQFLLFILIATQLFQKQKYLKQPVKQSKNGVVPVTISEGWNADVIAEARKADAHTTHTLDQQGWVLLYKCNSRARFFVR